MASPFQGRGTGVRLPTTTSMRYFTSGSTLPKLIASLAVLCAAAAIAGLGTYATFTSSTSASQTIATGTLSLTSGPTNRLGTGASLVAAGDSMQRAIDLNYAGSISFGSTTLTTSASPSSASAKVRSNLAVWCATSVVCTVSSGRARDERAVFCSTSITWKRGG